MNSLIENVGIINLLILLIMASNFVGALRQSVICRRNNYDGVLKATLGHRTLCSGLMIGLSVMLVIISDHMVTDIETVDASYSTVLIMATCLFIQSSIGKYYAELDQREIERKISVRGPAY